MENISLYHWQVALLQNNVFQRQMEEDLKLYDISYYFNQYNTKRIKLLIFTALIMVQVLQSTRLLQYEIDRERMFDDSKRIGANLVVQ